MRPRFASWLLALLLGSAGSAWSQSYSGVGTVQSIREAQEGAPPATAGNRPPR